jgi:GNAT superfamily N-acetyltransferase
MKLEIEPLTIRDFQIAKETLYPAFTGISEHYLGHSNAVPPWLGDDEKILKWMDEKSAFKVSIEGKLVAGFQINVQDPNNSWLNIIWVSPEEQRKGVGQEIWNYIESTYEKTKIWYLETPEFAVSNHHFYEKLGFVKQEIQETDMGIKLIIYRKWIKGREC